MDIRLTVEAGQWNAVQGLASLTKPLLKPKSKESIGFKCGICRYLASLEGGQKSKNTLRSGSSFKNRKSLARPEQSIQDARQVGDDEVVISGAFCRAN